MELIGNGLRGEYYDNYNLTNLKFTRTDSNVDFNWGTGSPASGIGSDTFSVRWTGQIQPETSGNYTFFVRANDGVRLWVNGKQLIDDWEDAGVVSERSGSISLSGNQKYDIKLEYLEWEGSASAQLLWSGPSLNKQVIPQSHLYSIALGDSAPPTAGVTAPDILTEGGSVYDFTVTYSDNTAVNVGTLNSSDILVTGSQGFSQMATLIGVNNNSNGTPRTATYRITAPGGSWTIDDNGRYTFALQPNQVSDTSGNFMPASTLGSFQVNLPLPTNVENENIVFPADSGVINVKTQFGAKGDGVTDDTAAIQAALDAYPNGNRIIYLPNGVYLVSDRLNWPEGTVEGQEYKRTILQGQSEQGTIIKLKDNAAGFTDVNEPKSVIFTGPSPAQRFRNSIRNLTLDTGRGNIGAIGIQFNASNQGTVREVTIRSGDGLGVNGLDMNFMDEIGPLLVKNVTVQGFQYGIRTGFTVNSQTFENIKLENQSVYGFYNTGQVINIRGLTSTNGVTAVYNARGRMTLIDASFTGINGAINQPALRNDPANSLFVRNLTTSGYQAAIQSAGNIQTGPLIGEFSSGGIRSLFETPTKTLNLPIRETPDVPWDNPTTTPWANVVSFGAIPDDGRDDSEAVQRAIDSGRTTVYFPNGTYDLRNTVLVRNNVRRVIGTEAKVIVGTESNQSYTGFKLVDGTSPVVVFERLEGGYYQNPTFENASARTIVIRHSLNVSGNMTGSGDVFLEDVVSNPFSNWTFNQQNIWARQFNVEYQGTHITNNGGNLWILGLKTERGGTLIHTKNGGKTELLGGFAYTTTAAPDGTQNDPMFINDESSISVSLAEINYGGGPNYTTYIQEKRNGITRNLSRSSVPSFVGSGRQIPLYVGYKG
ncbi:endopolygalacturonase [[Phormidium ambiguum] IAM M-71]|uniref:Endopolygalacturonase n=1 Tax=[Phormidium ambiguum] IAM M-71 TaxID=454136 RepID=A0A1U7IMN1_9CYAN|nr:glycosyl hydrolase family 28-related protein [Phormidium ambiguum]OKH38477.1 endopolygalacturonase [Phormidium ambiguum IAM M-71]